MSGYDIWAHQGTATIPDPEQAVGGAATIGGLTLPIDSRGKVEDADGVVWALTDESGWYAGPGVSRDLQGRRTGHGSFDSPGRRPARPIRLGGFARARTRAPLMRAAERINAVLGDGDAGLLTVVDDLGTRAALVRLSGDPAVRWVNDGRIEWQLSLAAADPRKYGRVQETGTYLPSPGTGLQYPLQYGLDYGPTGDPGRRTIVNTGTAPTAPWLGVAGPLLEGHEVSVVETGERLRFTGPLSAGQNLLVDCSNGHVMIDAVADRRAEMVVADFFTVPAGATRTLQFSTLGPYEPAARLTVGWASAWW